MKLFSVRDINLGFNQPFCDSNEDVAKRGFAFSVNHTDLIGFAPGDFDLYCIGEFDIESGQITPQLPQLVCHATEVYGS